jgi:cell cycle checkpoint protein
MEENGIIVDCSLKTQDPDEILDFDLDPEAVVNKVLLQSELLKDVFAELDPSSSYLEVKEIKFRKQMFLNNML